MTPNEIEVLIHCHVSPAPHPRLAAPAVQEAMKVFIVHKLIHKDDEGIYHTTDRGAAHIEQLCRTSWPVRAWADSDGNVINS